MHFLKTLRQRFLLYIIGFASLLILFTFFGGRGLVQIYHLKDEQEKIQTANARLREENRRLAEQIARMKNGKGEVEKIAREELGLVKKGEVIYQFEK